MLEEKQIISSFSNLKEKPKMESNLESQCLFGEKVLVSKQNQILKIFKKIQN